MLQTILLIINFWPFDLATTLWMIFILFRLVQLAIKQEWSTLKKEAYSESLKFFLYNLDKNTKLKAVLEKVRAKMPPLMRPFVSDEKIKQMITDVYQMKAKPQAKLEGLDKLPKIPVKPSGDKEGGFSLDVGAWMRDISENVGDYVLNAQEGSLTMTPASKAKNILGLNEISFSKPSPADPNTTSEHYPVFGSIDNDQSALSGHTFNF